MRIHYSWPFLVPRTSWRPEYEYQEALGTQDLKSKIWGLPVISDFFATFLIAVTCSCPSVIDCKFRWFKAFKRKSSNFHLNRKWPEVLKSSTSNAVSLVSPEPPGPRAQAPRGLWGRECSWPSRAILNTVFSWIIAGGDYFFFPTKRERFSSREGDYSRETIISTIVHWKSCPKYFVSFSH